MSKYDISDEDIQAEMEAKGIDAKTARKRLTDRAYRASVKAAKAAEAAAKVTDPALAPPDQYTEGAEKVAELEAAAAAAAEVDEDEAEVEAPKPAKKVKKAASGSKSKRQRFVPPQPVLDSVLAVVTAEARGAREIAEDTDRGYGTVFDCLTELHKQGLIVKTTKGRSNVWSLAA